MILIFGGAFQGKKDYIKEKYQLTDEDFFLCTKEGKLDFGKKVIADFEEYLFFLMEENIDIKEWLKENKAKLLGKVIICKDISQGVVPLEYKMRNYREYVGRTLIIMAQDACEVFRVFCGIGQKLK